MDPTDFKDQKDVRETTELLARGDCPVLREKAEIRENADNLVRPGNAEQMEMAVMSGDLADREYREKGADLDFVDHPVTKENLLIPNHFCASSKIRLAVRAGFAEKLAIPDQRERPARLDQMERKASKAYPPKLAEWECRAKTEKTEFTSREIQERFTNVPFRKMRWKTASS